MRAFLAVVIAAPAAGDVSIGFVEDFSSGLGGFAAGAVNVENPGTDGAGGAGDGFLRVSRSFFGPFAVRSLDEAYVGDWIDAGVTGVEFSLRDVDAADPDLNIRIGLGNQNNFWVSDAAFNPTGDWQAFSVELSSGFTQVIGTGSFEDALRNVDRFQFRHELDPILDGAQNADGLLADLGIDNIALVPAPASALVLASLGGLGRRRSGV